MYPKAQNNSQTTNPEEPSFNSINSTPAKQSYKEIHQQIQHLLAKKEIALAHSLTSNNPQLQLYLHSQLFKIDILQVLRKPNSNRNETDFIHYSQQLDNSQTLILQEVVKLKQRKSVNTMLINIISQKINDIMRGVQVEQDSQPLMGKTALSKKIIEPLRTLSKMMKSNESEKISQLSKYYSSQNVNVSHLERKIQSLEQQNSALLLKEKINKQKIFKLINEAKAANVASINIRKQLNQQMKSFTLEKERINAQHCQKIQELSQLVDKHSISGIVYAHIGATISDMKSLVLKLYNQNRILNDQRDSMNNNLNYIESEINKNGIVNISEKEEFLKDLQTKVSIQQKYIAQLEDKVKQHQNSRLNDSLSHSSSFLEESPKKLRRNNVQRLNQTNKTKEVEIRNLKLSLKEKEQIIAQLEDKLKESISFDMADSLLLSGDSFHMNESSTKQVKINKSSLIRLTDDNRRKDEEISELNKILKSIVTKVAKMEGKTPEEIIQDLQIKIALTEGVLADEQNKSKELANKNNSLQEQIDSLRKTISLKEELLQTQKQSNQHLQTSNEDLKKIHQDEIAEITQEKESLLRKIKQLQQFIGKLEESSKKELQEFEEALMEMKEREEKLHQEMRSLQGHLEKMNETGSCSEPNESEISRKIEEYNELLVEYDVIQNQKDQLISKNKSLETMLEYSKNKQKQTDIRCKAAEKKLHSILSQKDFIEKFPNNMAGRLFQGQILENSCDAKIFLQETIQKRFNRKILSTKLIYQMDSLNPTSFHSYVDQKEFILVLVELPNHAVVAGYYDGKYFPKMVVDKDALLISVTNREVFELLTKNKKGCTYDENSFILGNSELKVKPSQNVFYSNFGLVTGCFRNRGLKVETLTGLGDQERQLKYDNLEIYEVNYL